MTTTAFDLDGVLSRHDTMAAVVLDAIRRRPLAAVPVAILAVAAWLASPVGHCRPWLNRRIVQIALRGMTTSEYRTTVERVVRRLTAIDRNLPPQALHAFQAARARGSVYVLTATEDSLARAYLTCNGITGAIILASHLDLDSRAVTFRWHNVGDNKRISLSAHDADLRIDQLYTDSASDRPLASVSARTTLVNAGHRSRRLLRSTCENVRFEVW